MIVLLDEAGCHMERTGLRVVCRAGVGDQVFFGFPAHRVCDDIRAGKRKLLPVLRAETRLIRRIGQADQRCRDSDLREPGRSGAIRSHCGQHHGQHRSESEVGFGCLAAQHPHQHKHQPDEQRPKAHPGSERQTLIAGVADQRIHGVLTQTSTTSATAAARKTACDDFFIPIPAFPF